MQMERKLLFKTMINSALHRKQPAGTFLGLLTAGTTTTRSERGGPVHSPELKTVFHGNCRLAGKVAVVTGAASKLGQAIARKFVDHGARVIVADLSLASCENIALDINRTKSGMAHGMACNVIKASDILAAVNEAEKIFKREVDIFYNNAAVKNVYSSPNSCIDMTSFTNTMKVNVQSVIASIEHAGSVMRNKKVNKGGVILCTGSTVGPHGGDVVPSAYSISKAAVIGVVRAAAAELGSDGVRVNAISPHGNAARFDMGVLKQIFPRANDLDLEKMITDYGANKVTEEDVANAAVYLASEAGKSVNGQNFVLNDNFTL